MNRKEILDKAYALISIDRDKEYGPAKRNFDVIAKLWGAYLNKELDAVDVSILMALLKISRLQTNKKKLDSWQDATGYIALGGEIATEDES
mgnify:CR=1 FL=1